MELLKQTREVVKSLPPFFKAAFFIWSTVPIWFIVPSIKNSSFMNTTYAFFFMLIWIMINLAITLSSVFQRENKKALKQYAQEKSIPKLSGQAFAAAMQSKSAYEHLVARLPPHLTSDLGLYVAAKWGRIAKVMMIIMTVTYLGAIILTAQFSQ